MELIDKSAVVAEIEKELKAYESTFKDNEFNNPDVRLIAKGSYFALRDLRDYIVKEVNSTDAFIEKATSYIQQHWIWNTKMIEDFKNYMKGE